MDFWQSVTTFSLVFGLISSLVAVLGFFVDVTKIKHKHKILLVSVPLALIFIAGGTVSFAYRLTPFAKENSSHSKGSTTNTTTPTSVPTTSAFQPANFMWSIDTSDRLNPKREASAFQPPERETYLIANEVSQPQTGSIGLSAYMQGGAGIKAGGVSTPNGKHRPFSRSH